MRYALRLPLRIITRGVCMRDNDVLVCAWLARVLAAFFVFSPYRLLLRAAQLHVLVRVARAARIVAHYVNALAALWRFCALLRGERALRMHAAHKTCTHARIRNLFAFSRVATLRRVTAVNAARLLRLRILRCWLTVRMRTAHHTGRGRTRLHAASSDV